MPRLSIDARLRRQLAATKESTRFVDLSAVVRRLFVRNPNLCKGAQLLDRFGREWVAGEEDGGVVPVSSKMPGMSRKTQVGEGLKGPGGESVVLESEDLLRVGGEWDTLKNEWRLLDGKRSPGRGRLVVDAQESQVEAFRWLSERLAFFTRQEVHPQVAGLLFDDRRGGKTFFATVATILVALDCPRIDGSPIECRIVTQTVAARDEIDEIFAMLKIEALGWACFREQPKRIWRFVTGAKIRFLTSDNGDTLLEGRQDLVVLNEAAIFPLSTYKTLVRATQDRRGFVILATNKPKKARGNWVAKMWKNAEFDEAGGAIPAVKRLRVKPAKNAAISAEAKGPIARSILYALDGDNGDNDELDEGLIAEVGAKLFAPPWSDLEHLRPLPEIGFSDVTGEFTEFAFGRRFELLVGQDYQWQCAGSAWKLLAPGGNLASVQLWCVWALWLKDRGDEDDLLSEMEFDGLTADRCLVIPDCSGGSQGGQHKHGIEPPSFQRLRERGFEFQEPVEKRGPDTKHARNPRVATSVMRSRKWIQDGRVFVSNQPEARKMAQAFARCDAAPDRYGDLRPKGPWAHLIDTFRYPHWWTQRWLVEILRSREFGVGTQLSAALPRRR